MKKYQQLLLALLSIFSFSLFLIYRHEYNKLHYVLEVFNFFGTPGLSTPVPPMCNQNGTLKKLPLPPNPLPAWQRISNELYIYSAYWEKTGGQERVKTFAVGALNENLNYGCYLWYNSIPKTKPGSFSFSGLPYKTVDANYNKGLGKNKPKALVFYCEAETKGLTPVGVTFYKATLNDTSQGYIPIASLKSSYPPKNSTGICVMPTLYPIFDRSLYLEFLSFHKIIGVNDFVVYGSNDQHNLLSTIQSYSSYKVGLTVLPWNYPFFGDPELMKVIAENDCITRTTGEFENLIILDWNKFMVPRHKLSISKILNELDHEGKAFKFHFSNLVFCLEYKDSSNMNSSASSPLILKKNKYSLPKLDIPVPVYRPYVKTGKVQKVSKEIIAVHYYTSCKDIKLKLGSNKMEKIEDSVYKFQRELLNSKLLHV